METPCNERLPKVFELLMQNNPSPACTESMGNIYTLIVLNQSAKEMGSEGLLHLNHSIFNTLAYKHVSTPKIADTMQALAMLEPQHAHEILKIVNQLLNPAEGQTLCDLNRGKFGSWENAFMYIAGLLLGIFQTSNYMDSEEPDLAQAEFEQELTAVIIATVSNPNPLHFSIKAEKVLTKAMARYCRQIQDTTNRRLAKARIISLQKISETIDKMAKPKHIPDPNVSSLLAHELSAKALSALNLRQKAQALKAGLTD